MVKKGFRCRTCKVTHKFEAWVYAHWNEELVHTCQCGAKHALLRGHATQTVAGKVEARHADA